MDPADRRRCPVCRRAVVPRDGRTCPRCGEAREPEEWEAATRRRPVEKPETDERGCPECGTRLVVRGAAWNLFLLPVMLFVWFGSVLGGGGAPGAGGSPVRGAVWIGLGCLIVLGAFFAAGGRRFVVKPLAVCHHCGYARLGENESDGLRARRSNGIRIMGWLTGIIAVVVLFGAVTRMIFGPGRIPVLPFVPLLVLSVCCLVLFAPRLPGRTAAPAERPVVNRRRARRAGREDKGDRLG